MTGNAMQGRQAIVDVDPPARAPATVEATGPAGRLLCVTGSHALNSRL